MAGSSDQARRLGATLIVPSEPPYADPHVRVVWEPGLAYWVSLRRPDSAFILFMLDHLKRM